MYIRLRTRVEGTDELKDILIGPEEIAAAMRTSLEAIGKETVRRIAPYPPETTANMPGPYPKRWYQRHKGPRWARKVKRTPQLDRKGQPIKRAGVGGSGEVGGRNTSEVLQKQWKIQLGPGSVTVENDASYADVVHNKEEQAKIHGKRGWLTDQQVIDELSASGYLDKAIDQQLNKLFTGGL